MSDFVEKHNTIDQAIKKEKAKSKLISRFFLITDILMSVLIPGVRILVLNVLKAEVVLYPQTLIATFSLILAGSAFYITRSVKKSTGKRQNTCLLNWHIVNLFLLVATLIPTGTLY